LAHVVEIREQRVEVGIGELRVRRHLRVAERARVADEGAQLRLGPELDHALRHVELGPDAPAVAVHRVAREAVAAAHAEADGGGRRGGGGGGGGGRPGAPACTSCGKRSSTRATSIAASWYGHGWRCASPSPAPLHTT